MVRCAVRLEVVDADLAALMQVPARLRPSWLGVAAGAVGFPAEQLVTAFGRVLVEAALRRSWRGNRQLIEMQRRKLGADQVNIVVHMPKVVGSCDRILLRIV